MVHGLSVLVCITEERLEKGGLSREYPLMLLSQLLKSLDLEDVN